MRKLFLIIAVMAPSIFMVSCGGGEEKTSDLTEKNTDEKAGDDENNDSDAEEAGDNEEPKADLAGKKAIALWDQTSYYKEPNKGWAGRVVYGNSLTLTGDTAIVNSKNRSRTHYKVKTPDGHEGWIYDYYLALDAEVKVVTEDQIIYKNPDVTSLTDKKFVKGEMIALINSGEESNGFAKAQNANRKINGGSSKFVWIKKARGLSSDETDIMIATQLRMVDAEKDEKKKIEKLDAILENESNRTSKLYEVALNKKNELVGSEEETPMDEAAEEEVGEEAMEEATEE